MRSLLVLIVVVPAAVLFQLGLFPVLIPALLRPDLGLLVGIALLAFGSRNAGLIALFCLGLQADLFGSARFGLLTLSYLLAVGMILWVAWRELARGDLLPAWIGGIAATVLAHVFYVVLGRLCGSDVRWTQATGALIGLTLASCLWGLPVVWLCGQVMFRLGAMTPQANDRWVAERRLAALRRGNLARS